MDISDIELGQVVKGRHLTDEGDETLKHYFLVLEKEERFNGTRIRAAYGTSKHVCRDGHLPAEFVVVRDEDLDDLGLKTPTRFDCRRVLTLLPEDIFEVCGDIRRCSSSTKRRLKKALEAA